MASLDINGPAYETVINQNGQRLINWYLEDDQALGKYPYILRPTPGLLAFGTLGSGLGSVRGLFEHKGVLYAVADDTVYSVDSSGTESSLGTIGTTAGHVNMTASNDQLIIVDGSKGYTYTISTTTFAEITDGDFPASPDDVTYMDGYFIVISSTDQKFYISAINDGQDWNGLDFASATAMPDNLVACISDHRELWLFGDKSAEVWYNSGAATFPFSKRPGVLLHKGLAAKNSVARADNSIYWLSKDEAGQSLVVKVDGYTPKVISSRAISQAIDGYSTVSDAFAYVYRQGNHEFYVLTFPTENKTWVHDASTQQWHERDSIVNEEHVRHRSNCYAFAYGKHIVGNFNSGALYELSETTYTDAGGVIERCRRSPHISSDRQLVGIYNLVVDVEPGVGLDTGQGSDPQLMLRVSKDGGFTWGNEMWRDIGKAGTYSRRVKWDMLGTARDWVLEFKVTDPVNVVILGARADLEGGVFSQPQRIQQ